MLCYSRSMEWRVACVGCDVEQCETQSKFILDLSIGIYYQFSGSTLSETDIMLMVSLFQRTREMREGNGGAPPWYLTPWKMWGHWCIGRLMPVRMLIERMLSFCSNSADAVVSAAGSDWCEAETSRNASVQQREQIHDPCDIPERYALSQCIPGRMMIKRHKMLNVMTAWKDSGTESQDTCISLNSSPAMDRFQYKRIKVKHSLTNMLWAATIWFRSTPEFDRTLGVPGASSFAWSEANSRFMRLVNFEEDLVAVF